LQQRVLYTSTKILSSIALNWSIFSTS